jgi:hypothetical protein
LSGKKVAAEALFSVGASAATAGVCIVGMCGDWRGGSGRSAAGESR